MEDNGTARSMVQLGHATLSLFTRALFFVFVREPREGKGDEGTTRMHLRKYLRYTNRT